MQCVWTRCGAWIGLHWVLFILAVKISNVPFAWVGIGNGVRCDVRVGNPGCYVRRNFGEAIFVFGLRSFGRASIFGVKRSRGGVSRVDHICLRGCDFSIFKCLVARRLDHRVIACMKLGGAFCSAPLCCLFPRSGSVMASGWTLRPSLFDTVCLVVLASFVTVVRLTVNTSNC